MTEDIKMRDYYKNRIRWFFNPNEVDSIDWGELNHPAEESSSFEGNGRVGCPYIWGRRKRDNRYVRVGKIVQRAVFLPLLFVVSEFLMLGSFLWDFGFSHSIMIELFCMYGVMFCLFLHYLFGVLRV